MRFEFVPFDVPGPGQLNGPTKPNCSGNTNLRVEELYENAFLFAGAVRISWLRLGTPGHDHNNNRGHARNRDYWSRRDATGYARGFGYPSAAASSGRDENRCTRADLRLDEWLLAMDGRALCMGAGALGRASASGRGLG
jgi:hypothetical protein